MQISDQSTIGDLLDHPVGHDVVAKVLLQMGKSFKLVDNALVRRLKLGHIKRLVGTRVSSSFFETAYNLFNSETDLPKEGTGESKAYWWKEAVFYQIYPRSFQDSNGDGIGDLNGILSKLDYLEDLGVDALWLSPIYDSPNDDNGYDIRDYHKIMEEMGTMEDFDRLLEEVHKRGMKLIMDLVVNHTSDEHKWFQEALKDPDGPYGKYYFFREGADETELPNNWVSFFSGPAWNWYEDQKRFAMHLFSSKQMDLNWDHKPLRDEVSKMVRWWLDKGVDGFRLDVINYISKQEGLPDGDPFVGELMHFYGIEHYYYGPKLHDYLRELRQEAFKPYDAFSVGETPGIGIEMGRLLTGEDRQELDLIFNFDHLEMPGQVRFDEYQYDLNFLKDYYINYHNRLSHNDWMSIFFDNHDNPRMLSKILEDVKWRDRLAKLLLSWQLTMKGTVFLYQGQELAAINQSFTDISQLRDVESINKFAELSALTSKEVVWNVILSGTRDHARVPMRWTEEDKGGFTSGTPWISWPSEDPGYSAKEQAKDLDSVLNFTKDLIQVRRSYPALRMGDINFIDAKRKNYFAYERVLGDERIFCEFNLSSERLARNSRMDLRNCLLSNVFAKELHYDRHTRVLEPYEASIYLVSK